MRPIDPPTNLPTESTMSRTVGTAKLRGVDTTPPRRHDTTIARHIGPATIRTVYHTTVRPAMDCEALSAHRRTRRRRRDIVTIRMVDRLGCPHMQERVRGDMTDYLQEFASLRRLELSNGRPSALSLYPRPRLVGTRPDFDYRAVPGLAHILRPVDAATT